MNQENQKLLTLLENSNSLILEKNGKNITMPHPMDIYEKFTSVVPTDNIRIAYQGKEMLEDEGLKYGIDKYMFIAELPKSIEFDKKYEHRAKVGIIIGNKSNVMKVWSGMEASACLNMSVFGADSLQEDKISPNLIKDMVLLSKKEIDNKIEDWQRKIWKLINNTYDAKSFEARKGKLLTNLPVNLFSYIKHAEEQMRDANSLYYNWQDSDWKLLSAMTDLNSKKGILNRINEIIKLEAQFLN
jgi:hypothetical protein